MDQNNLNKTATSKISSASKSGGLADLPPLDSLATAEDDTFSPPPAPPVEKKSDLPPLPSTPAPLDYPESTEKSFVGTNTDPSSPNPLTSVGTIENGEKSKKKLNKKAIVGAVIALVLLVGVPVVALNIDKFRGDIRQRAYIPKSTSKSTTIGTKTKGITKPTSPAIKGGSKDKSPLTKGIAKPTSPATADREDYEDDCARGYVWTGTSCKFDKGLLDQLNKDRDAAAEEILAGNSSGVGGQSSSSKDTCGPELICNGQNIGGTLCMNKGGSPEGCKTSAGRDGTCCLPGGGSSGAGGEEIDRSAPTVWNNGCTDKAVGTACFSRDVNDFQKKGVAGTCQVIGNTSGANIEGICVTGGGSGSDTPSGGGGGGGSGGGGGDSVACVETRTYTLQGGNWTLTGLGSVGQYAGVGDKVRLAVRGNSSQFASGRFRVNGGSWATTTTKNSAGEFYIEYTLSQTGKYTIEGQVQ